MSFNPPGSSAYRERLEVVQGQHRSVSQVTSYLPEYGGCPKRYELERVQKVWQRPAAWGPMGTGVHKAAEEFEKSGRTMQLPSMMRVFEETYAEEINLLGEETPNWSEWFDSNQADGAADVERRYGLGKAQVARYRAYYLVDAPDEVIWIDKDGNPAIEKEFNTEWEGIRVTGFIDQVVTVKPPFPRTASGAKSKSPSLLATHAKLPRRVRPRDIKTGTRPGKPIQLGIYKEALCDEQPDLRPQLDGGDFWMGRNGRPGRVVPLPSRDEVVDAVVRADYGIKTADFTANPGDNCTMCSVKTSCPFAV